MPVPTSLPLTVLSRSSYAVEPASVLMLVKSAVIMSVALLASCGSDDPAPAPAAPAITPAITPAISVSPSAVTLERGADDNLPIIFTNSGGGSLSALGATPPGCASTPALPAGLMFELTANNESCRITGMPEAETAQPLALMVTATNSAGTSAPAALTLTVADTAAPAVTVPAQGAVTAVTPVSATVNFTVSEAGAAYALALLDTAAAPTAAEVKSMVGAMGGVAYAEVAVTAAGPAAASLSGLSANTAYTVYIIIEDSAAAVNTSAVAEIDVMTSSAPPTNPPPTEPAVNQFPVYADGAVASAWNDGINAFDSAIGYGECSNDGGAACPSIAWTTAADSARGDVLQVSHTSSDLAGLFIRASSPQNLLAYAAGGIVFDIRSVSGSGQMIMKLDCVYPCTSGEQTLTQTIGSEWETVTVPMSQLQNGGLDLTKISTGLVIWASQRNNTVFQLDNIRFLEEVEGGEAVTTPPNENEDRNGGGTTASGEEFSVFDNGMTASAWSDGINAFDAAINFGECAEDGGAACPSIAWTTVTDPDPDRGDVLQVSHTATDLAGLFFLAGTPQNLSAYGAGGILFDIRTVSGSGKITMKLDCVFPCTSGDQPLAQTFGSEWETVTVPMNQLQRGGLDITKISTGLVIWATDRANAVFQLDNVRFVETVEGGSVVNPGTSNVEYELTEVGMGSYSDTINPASHRCVTDHGNWIFNAGVVMPGIDGCITATRTPIGSPTPLMPQLTGEAATKPTATHRWWGSVPFLGEMEIGNPNNAAYITPDPITARVHNLGVRVMGIPSGLGNGQNQFLYSIPDPFAEVFDGISIGSTVAGNLQAYAKKTDDGSITVQWQSNAAPVLEATFAHGSPYIYFKTLQGNLVVKTLRADGGEKGVFHQAGNSLGIWTSVAGNRNNYLITGEGSTTFTNANSNLITASNSAGEYTVALLPEVSNDAPGSVMISFFEDAARNVVDGVEISYVVKRADNSVTVTHKYLDANGDAIETIAGLHPLHWKNSEATLSSYQVRSARGVIKFAQTSSFSYTVPYIGALPALPSVPDSVDAATLTALVNEFVDTATSTWNTRNGRVQEDAYWSGKNYAKVAELLAIADSAGLTAQRKKLLDWLKAELADWLTAETDDALDSGQYFVYDDDWSTLLAMEESFSSHQQLNDHHFHYGYFVRAAAEICRHEPAWCSDEQYGGMVKLLIRDYAAGRDDALFPYLRHFDPANGFSWASGNVNFARGNNNESTSEAANAYGAMVLFGLIINDENLVNRGIYLHALTGASYWEYWNNIDGYKDTSADADNFWPGYERITTSIIWGDGGVFSTWFSPAFAHILGIQGLPTNPLVLHVGLYPDYMAEYVKLGLAESSNNKPSGLIPDQWRDIWWNLMAINDAPAAIADYETVSSYVPEQGESKAHTYHWIHTFKQLGQLATGLGELTADYPAAMAFTKGEQTSYVVYNYSSSELTVTFSDETEVVAPSGSFGIVVSEPESASPLPTARD